MFKTTLLILLFSICLIRSGQTTKQLLRVLLTTTPSSSHISDFRNQRRTDSRADKPDTFPGFDLLEDVTQSPRKRRRQAYSQLIRLFLENTRERLDAIRDVVSHQGEAMSNAPVDVIDRLSLVEVNKSSDGPELLRLSLDTENSAEDTQQSNSIPESYAVSLLNAIGLNRIPVMTTAASARADRQMAQNNVITTYFFNPLLDLWKRAQARLNSTSNEYDGVNNSSDSNNNAERIFVFDSLVSKSEAKMSDIKTNPTKMSREYDEYTANDRLPLALAPLIDATRTHDEINGDSDKKSSETSDDSSKSDVDTKEKQAISMGSSEMNMDTNNHHNNNMRSANNGDAERAAGAFRNAFLKYSNYQPALTMRKNSQLRSGDDINELLANIIRDDPNHIQVVPSRNDSDPAKSGRQMASGVENAGIYALEIVGTVAGLAWGAFSHIQSFLHPNNGTHT